jgi:membrane protease YdiL (CAAX protease family)
LGCVILFASTAAGLIAAVVLVMLLTGGRTPNIGPGSLFEEYESLPRLAQLEMEAGLDSNGTLLSLINLFSTPVALFLIALVVRGYGASPRSFLGLRRPTIRQAILWTSAVLALEYGLDALFESAGFDVGDDSAIELYRTALFLPLFYLALVVLGPAFEEILFRGFLLEGWRQTRLGAVGAAALTSTLWALLHSYPAAAVFIIFCEGLVLAAARLRTGSTFLAMLMHGCLNLMVLIQVGFFLTHQGTEYFLKKGREQLGRDQYWEAFLAFHEAERYARGPVRRVPARARACLSRQP